MEIDIAIIIIVGLFAFLGLRNGFFYTLFRALGWLIAIVGALLLGRVARGFLKDHTLVYDAIFEKVKAVCLNFTDQYVSSRIPAGAGAIGDNIRNLAEQAAISTAETIADVILAMITFIVLVVLIKLVLFLVTRLFSKKHHKGFIGGIDGIAGMALGAIQGILVVLVLLTVLIPASFAFGPESYMKVNSTLERSFFAYNVYHANPIPKFIGTVTPEQLLANVPGIDSMLQKLPSGQANPFAEGTQ